MVLIACSLDDSGRKWPKPTRAGFNGNGDGLQIDYYTVIFSFVTYWLLDLHVSFYTLPSN